MASCIATAWERPVQRQMPVHTAALPPEISSTSRFSNWCRPVFPLRCLYHGTWPVQHSTLHGLGSAEHCILQSLGSETLHSPWLGVWNTTFSKACPPKHYTLHTLWSAKHYILHGLWSVRYYSIAYSLKYYSPWLAVWNITFSKACCLKHSP
jgi:hypothetical protein